MTSVIIDVPAMYADHHVVEVRRILNDVPGVRAVYASSAFRIVEVDFDPEHTSAEALERVLEEAGYRSDLPVPVEPGEPAPEGGRYRRRTAIGAPSGTAVAFRQELGGPAGARAETPEAREG